MKFSKCFILAGAAALLAACSSEEPIVGPGADQPDLSDVETYAQFTISMVGDNGGTRAADLQEGLSYENGTPGEYKVKSGKILVFGLPKGPGNQTVENRVKAEYIVTANFEMTPDATDETDDLDAIGSKVKAKFKKGTFSVSNYDHYYGVVILNSSDSWLPTVGQTFRDWAENQNLKGELYDSEGYMVMTNAPKYAAGNPTVLVEIDTDKVKDKEEDVTEDAAKFYVQRVAAKVTLANAKTTGGVKEFTVADGAYKDGKATITGWKMDLTRKTAYPVQNVWGENVKEFFVAGAKEWFHGGSPERCHWADSKFYTTQMSVDDCKENFNFYGNIPGTMNALTDGGCEYIRPNTMAYNRMSKGQTTRMIIRANFLPKGVAAATTFFKCAGSEVLYTEETLKDKVVELYKKVSGTVITADKVTVTVGNSGWKTFTSVVAIDGEDKATSTNYSKIAALLGAVDYDNAGEEIAVYKGGVCYYPVYVRHFADEQEAAGVTVTKGSNLSIYKKEHTGRYGIQRNTWYDLKVTKVTGPGMPTVPEPRPTVPVDEEEDDGYRYLEVTCNILNWAMRSQNVEL